MAKPVTLVAEDFSGGMVAREASTDFSERQWARLKGVVLESESTLRSQWAWQKVGAPLTGLVDLAEMDGRLWAITSAGAVSQMMAPANTAVNATTKTAAWAAVLGGTSGLRFIGKMAQPDPAGVGFYQSLILNDQATTAPKRAHAKGGTPTIEAFTYPFPTGPTQKPGMPPASIATTWGDYLVLGDIQWLKSEASGFSSTNAARYPHGLWFSQPGEMDSWDTIDVEFMGVFKGAVTDVAVHSLVTVEAGMLVVTGAGVFMLRGNAFQHDYEELRVGVGTSGPGAATYWPHTGAACWVNSLGEVWTTNGSEFVRLDEPLGADRTAGTYDATVGFGEFLLAYRDQRLFAFRAFAQGGAWTELVAPADLRGFLPVGDQLYAFDGAGQVWRINRTLEAERGRLDGAEVEVHVGTRTLEAGDGHGKALWHRFGVRVDAGPAGGRIAKALVRPGPVLADGPAMTVTLDRKLGDRDAVAVPGHGPSVEASVEWVFTGDVSVEQTDAVAFRAGDKL